MSAYTIEFYSDTSYIKGTLNPIDKIGHINTLYVALYNRRHRLGTHLVSEFLNACKEQEIPLITLECFERNSDGIAFWESLGFQVDDGPDIEGYYTFIKPLFSHHTEVS